MKLLVFFAISLFALTAEGGSFCCKVRGRLHACSCVHQKIPLCCPTETIGTTRVTLWDSDIGWGDHDDFMNSTTVKSDGSFEVNGCSSDFGPWSSKSNVYIAIDSNCYGKQVNRWLPKKQCSGWKLIDYGDVDGELFFDFPPPDKNPE